MPVATFAWDIRGISTEYGRVGIQYDEALVQTVEEVTGTTDTALALGGVATVDFLFLISDQALTVNLQATTGTDITVDANKPLIVSGGSITGVWISNASGSTAVVRYIILGT